MTTEVSEKLAEYYRRVYSDKSGLTVSGAEEISRGWETELYSFKVEYDEGHRRIREERVVRIYPGRGAAQKAEKEYVVMSKLREVGYPVPEVFHIDVEGEVLGRPFIVMERIVGRSLMEDFMGGSKEGLEGALALMIGLFVKLHRIEVKRVFPKTNMRDAAGYIDSRLGWAMIEMEENGVQWIHPVIQWLEERKAGVAPERLVIVHRDFHPMNIMLREDGSPAVIDWGAAGVGDYRDDLAWSVLLAGTFWDFSLKKKILDEYESISGRKVREFEFFEVLAILRRLIDVSVSLIMGAEEMGMRAGAEEMMRESKQHLVKVHDLLKERTGLRLPEFEELLNKL